MDRDGGGDPREGRGWRGGAILAGWLQQSEDAPGEVALEAAQRFSAALALGLLAREVRSGFGVHATLGDREAMQRAVDLAVAAAVQAVALGAPG